MDIVCQRMDSSHETDGADDRKEAAPSTDRQADAQRSTTSERQAFGVHLPRPGDPALRALRSQNAPAYQGHRPWNASWLLISYLQQISLEGLQIVDVGCGWGLASIYCAQQGARVTAIDVDPNVFPFVQMLSDLNGVTIEHVTAGFDAVEARHITQTDLLIGADICFRFPMVETLFGLVKRGLETGLGAVAITDPGRIPYRDLAARCVAELGAREGPWQTEEPLLNWSGDRPTVTGRLLQITGS